MIRAVRINSHGGPEVLCHLHGHRHTVEHDDLMARASKAMISDVMRGASATRGVVCFDMMWPRCKIVTIQNIIRHRVSMLLRT
jgi:hypothetical protein